MLRPARMIHLNVLVLDSDVDRATSQMIKSGLVHLVSVTDLEPWADETGLKAVEEEDTPLLTQVQTIAQSVAEKLRVGPETVSEALAFQPFDPQEAAKKLEEISKEVSSVVAARDSAARELATLQEARSQATRDLRERFGIDVPSRYTLLEVALGRLPERNLHLLDRLLADVPNVVLRFPEQKGTVAVMAIVLKRDRAVLQRATEEVGLEPIPTKEGKRPLPDEAMEHLDDRIAEAQQQLQAAQGQVDQCREAHLAVLQTILSQITLRKLTTFARSRFRKTARTYLISGWTPRQSRKKVVEGLRGACGNRCLIEEQTAEELLSERGQDVDVPIAFENPKVLQPFEMLVSSYGPPAYNSVEPTLVVAPTFLLMYGAMFGDVGQGAVMAILGALVGRWKRVSHGVRRIGKLFTWCGFSAILFGILYGSVFGPSAFFQKLLPYPPFEPIARVNTVLMIALAFGMGMITLGLVFNAISAIRRREWATALFDWKGFMGLAFYWLGVALAVQILTGQGANRTLLGVLIVMPLLAGLLKAPMEKLIHPRGHVPEGGIVLQSLRSLGHMVGASFESVLMFFTNTLSFLRVAAFAIAHAGLFIAVFSLADALRGGGPALPIAIHVLGNAGMIALEGLVVCVQALRLEYYEFFGKFFRVGGTQFTPMKLHGTLR